jgi:uncharacterized protein YbcI
MTEGPLTIAQQVAQAALNFQRDLTGHTPSAVIAVISEGTLVVTLHGALTPAEKALALNAEGAARVQEFHRRLFASSFKAMSEEIKRITGFSVKEAAAEVEANSGTVVHAFTSGTMVQVYLLNETPSTDHQNHQRHDGQGLPPQQNSSNRPSQRDPLGQEELREDQD